MVIKGSKICKFHFSIGKSNTRVVCHDYNYLDIYLINVNLCVKSRVG
jgi:hypothetical protein